MTPHESKQTRPPSCTFMRFHTESLSVSEKQFIKEGAEQDIRIDGRKRLERRQVQLSTHTFPLASGSATLILDTTSVLVGIRASLGTPSLERPSEGQINFNVTCPHEASLSHNRQAQEIQISQIQHLISTILSDPRSYDLKSLSIIESQQCWILHVDALVLHHGGNVAESVYYAVRAALFSLQLPKATVTEEDGIKGIELSGDLADMWRPDASSLPTLLCLARMGQNYVVDPLWEEEESCDALFYIAVKGERLHYMKKWKSGLFLPSDCAILKRIAEQEGPSYMSHLDQILAEQSALPKSHTHFHS